MFGYDGWHAARFLDHARAGSTGAHSIVGSSDKMSRVVSWVRTVDTGASEVRNDLVFEHFPLCTVSPSVSPAPEHSRPLSWRKAGVRAAVLLGTAQIHHNTHSSRAAPRAEAMRARTTRWTGPTMRGVGRAVSRCREGVKENSRSASPVQTSTRRTHAHTTLQGVRNLRDGGVGLML